MCASEVTDGKEVSCEVILCVLALSEFTCDHATTMYMYICVSVCACMCVCICVYLLWSASHKTQSQGLVAMGSARHGSSH